MRATVVRGGRGGARPRCPSREPLGVPPHLEALLSRWRIAAHLLEVRRRVGVDLVLRQAGVGSPTCPRVADRRGEVADDQHRRVPGVLELPQLAQHDREAQVDVGRGRVDAELHPERPPGPSWSASSGSVTRSTAPARRSRAARRRRAPPRRTYPPPGRLGLTFGSPRTNQRHAISSPLPGARPTRADARVARRRRAVVEEARRGRGRGRRRRARR